MHFSFGQYKIEVDVERTRSFYESAASIPTSQQCTCDGCQNYDKAILTAPASVLNFLRSLGIDPCNPGEVYTVIGEREPDGRYWYGGWYHVVGRIVKKGEDDWYKPDPSYDFKVWFADDRTRMGWVEKEFPKPILELSIDAFLPYLLEE